MTTLNSYFNTFLHKIEPPEVARRNAIKAHKELRDAVDKSEKFGDCIFSTYLYGSYKRHTAIGSIKDVDIVLLTNLDSNSAENSPKAVLRRLKAALTDHYGDPKDTAYQRRSIRVENPIRSSDSVELTLDVIPAVLMNDFGDIVLVPDRELDRWIQSNPKGHINNTQYLNSEEYSEGSFVPLVKMFKWWWKNWCEENTPEIERPKPKGFWLEILASENFTPNKDLNLWADRFICLLQNIKHRYEHSSEVPMLKDPGLPYETIKTSMDNDEFQLFFNALIETLKICENAKQTEDDYESTVLWREVFGDSFPLYNEENSNQNNKHRVRLGDSSHKDYLKYSKKIDSKRGRVKIEASYFKDDVLQAGLKSDGVVLDPGLKIRFKAKTKIPFPYEVMWQVVNTGSHAKSIEGGLRGNIFATHEKPQNQADTMLVNWEHTLYTGKHWIQCYIIKGGYCVAESDKFYVNIYNPDYPND